MVGIRLVYEDPVSLAVMERLVHCHSTKLKIEGRIAAYGFGAIKKNIAKYNTAANTVPFFVLTDLDRGTCPVKLIANWLPYTQSPLLLFRVAVREVESWLLADREGFGGFLRISTANFKTAPDLLPDPKAEVFRLTKKCRLRDLREHILPLPQATIGPGYNLVIPRFARETWSPESARARSPSLDRAMKALKRLADDR